MIKNNRKVKVIAPREGLDIDKSKKPSKPHAGYINGLYIRSLDHAVMYEVLLTLEKQKVLTICWPSEGKEKSYPLLRLDGRPALSYKGLKLRYDLDFIIKYRTSQNFIHADFKGRVSGTNNHDFQLFWLKKLNVEDHYGITIEIWTNKTTKEFATLAGVDLKELKKSIQDKWIRALKKEEDTNKPI